MPTQSLRLHPPHESHMGRQYADPRQAPKDGDGRDEVVEDGQCRFVRDEVGQAHEAPGEAEGDPRDAAAVAPSEDTGGVAVFRHAVQGAGGDVLVGVGRGEGEEEDPGESGSAVNWVGKIGGAREEGWDARKGEGARSAGGGEDVRDGVAVREIKWAVEAEFTRWTHAALMICGKTLIPAASIATTNGLAEAPPAVPTFAACASC